MSQILDIIGHYQRSIERSQNGSSENANNGKLLHCIEKLYKLPITVDHLQATGIGKTVNSLRKYDGEVGVAAKALVAKWKAMVSAEEYATESTAANKTSDEEDDGDDDNNVNDNDEHDIANADGYGNNPRKSNGIPVEQDKNYDKKSEYRIHSSSHKSDNSKKSSSKENSSRSSSSSSKSKHKSDSKQEKSSQKSHSYKNEYADNESIKVLPPKFDENVETQRNNADGNLMKCSDISKNEINNQQHNSNSSNNHNKNIKNDSSSKNHHHSRIDEKSTSTSKSSSSSSSSKHRKEHHHNRENHKSSNSKDKDKDKYHHKSNSASNNTNKTIENHSNNIKEDSKIVNKDNKNNKRRHSITDTADKSCEVTSSSSTTATSSHKLKKQKIIHDEIDSTTGTSFEDALGMMIPMKLSNSSSKNTIKIKSPNTSKSNNSKSTTSSSSRGNCSDSSNGTSSKSHISHTSSTNKSDTEDIQKMTPSLLTSTVNLKPLDPNIALELPIVSISNNYKPMPLNQTVMDCVFRSNQPAKTTRTESEALTHSISSKTMRTKVYSGQRSGQRYQAPKLFDLCIRFLQKNIDAIEYCGGYPFEVLRHVLERATPSQLLNFEEWNQYIIEDTDELWKQHVQRQCRGQKRQEMESWREMYMRCKENEEHRLNMLAENIKQSQKLVAAPVKKTQLAFVDSMVKPPRNIQRKQDQFGTNNKLIATPAARVASLCNITPNAMKTGDIRLRIAAGERDNAQISGFIRPKKAPLMAKTIQLMKGRFKR